MHIERLWAEALNHQGIVLHLGKLSGFNWVLDCCSYKTSNLGSHHAQFLALRSGIIGLPPHSATGLHWTLCLTICELHFISATQLFSLPLSLTHRCTAPSFAKQSCRAQWESWVCAFCSLIGFVSGSSDTLSSNMPNRFMNYLSFMLGAILFTVTEPDFFKLIRDWTVNPFVTTLIGI